MERSGLKQLAADSRSGGERYSLGDSLGTEACAINWYVIEAGEELPGGVHAHGDQEELFVVRSGTATFETFDGRVSVGADEAIRFERDEFHHGYNAGPSTLELVAIGAPKDTSEIFVPFACADCGHQWLQLETDGRITFECNGCGTTKTPLLRCPACETGGLSCRLDADCAPIVRCDECGETFDRSNFDLGF